jgi:hypothetical protein
MHLRLAALGDSTTYGIGDLGPWAVRMALSEVSQERTRVGA